MVEPGQATESLLAVEQTQLQSVVAQVPRLCSPTELQPLTQGIDSRTVSPLHGPGTAPMPTPSPRQTSARAGSHSVSPVVDTLLLNSADHSKDRQPSVSRSRSPARSIAYTTTREKGSELHRSPSRERGVSDAASEQGASERAEEKRSPSPERSIAYSTKREAGTDGIPAAQRSASPPQPSDTVREGNSAFPVATAGEVEPATTDNTASHSFLVVVQEEAEEEAEPSLVQYKLSSSINQGEKDIATDASNVAAERRADNTLSEEEDNAVTDKVGASLSLVDLGVDGEYSVEACLQEEHSAGKGGTLPALNEAKQKSALATMAVALLTIIHGASEQSAREIMRLLPEKPSAAAQLTVTLLQQSAAAHRPAGRVMAEVKFDPEALREERSADDVSQLAGAALLPLEPNEEIEVLHFGDRGWAFGSKATAKGVEAGWFPWDFVSSDFKTNRSTVVGEQPVGVHGHSKEADAAAPEAPSGGEDQVESSGDPQAVALCGWQAHRPWATSLAPGERVRVRRRAHGWAYAVRDQDRSPEASTSAPRRGWVPARFLSLLPASDALPTSLPPNPPVAAAAAPHRPRATQTQPPLRAASLQQPQRSPLTRNSPQPPAASPSPSPAAHLTRMFSRGALPELAPSLPSTPPADPRPGTAWGPSNPLPASTPPPVTPRQHLQPSSPHAFPPAVGGGWRPVDSPAEARFQWNQRFGRRAAAPQAEEVESTVSPPASSLNASRAGSAPSGKKASGGMTQEQAWRLLGEGFIDSDSEEKLLYA